MNGCAGCSWAVNFLLVTDRDKKQDLQVNRGSKCGIYPFEILLLILHPTLSSSIHVFVERCFIFVSSQVHMLSFSNGDGNNLNDDGVQALPDSLPKKRAYAKAKNLLQST